MRDVERLAREIVEREGGFVNDPDDPGGATKYGVTIHTMHRLGIDLDRDGDVDVDDVRALTVDDAVRIFLQHYYRRPGIWRLPEPLQPEAFDFYVNAGANAIRVLQRVLREFGEDVTVDGIIGPQTAAAAKRVYERAGDYLVDAYGIARREWYLALADRRPTLRKFARRRDGGKGGWIKRAEEFIRPRFRLNEDEWRQRVASWG